MELFNMPKNIRFTYGVMVYLSGMYKKYSKIKNKEIYIDFKNTKNIEEEMIAVLGIIFTKIKSNKNKVFLRGLSKKNKNILMQFGFINSVNILEDISNNYIKYNTFDGDNEGYFKEYLNKELAQIYDQDLISYIRSHIIEVFLNIRHHARIDINKNRFKDKEVFSSGCYKKLNNQLVLSICNNGRTFAENIKNKTNIQYLEECQYINWALEECNSTTENRPGGAGLAMLKELVKKCNGELLIYSGKGFYCINKNNGYQRAQIKDLNVSVPITAIVIKLPLNYINEIKVNQEEEFSIEDILLGGD